LVIVISVCEWYELTLPGGAQRKVIIGHRSACAGKGKRHAWRLTAPFKRAWPLTCSLRSRSFLLGLRRTFAPRAFHSVRHRLFVLAAMSGGEGRAARTSPGGGECALR